MRGLLLGLSMIGLMTALPASAARKVDCELRYSVSGWSLLYQTANGSGTVHCDNGTRIPVRIQIRGGGLSVGKTRINNGRGHFTGAPRAEDVLGTYVSAEAHAAAHRAGNAQVLSKGKVSLALAGRGEGWSLGVGVNRFVIERR